MAKKSSSSASAKTPTAVPVNASVPIDIERLQGKTYTVAGTLKSFERTRLENLLDSEGANLVDEVSEKVDAILLGNVSGKTTVKQKQAEKLNLAGKAKIETITLEDFYKPLVEDVALAVALLKAGPAGVERFNLLRSVYLPLELIGVDLQGIKIEKLYLWKVVFRNCDLRKCEISNQWSISAPGSRFDEADLKNVGLHDFDGAKAPKANLTRARITTGSMQRADLREAIMVEFCAERVNATKSNFSKADLSRANLKKGTFVECNFSNANMSAVDAREADLSKARFHKASLAGADFSKAKLHEADLSKADLRGAILADTDFTGAKLDGADFTGANVVGAKFDNVDISKAIDLRPVTAPATQSTTHLTQLDALAAKASRLKLLAQVRLTDGQVAVLEIISTSKGQRIEWGTPKKPMWSPAPVNSLSDAMTQAAMPFLRGRLDLSTLSTKVEGTPGGKAASFLAAAAWCEVFGYEIPTGDELKDIVAVDQHSNEAVFAAMLAELRGGAAGIKKFMARPKSEREQTGSFEKVDLSGCTLDEVDFSGLDLREANLSNISMKEGHLYGDCRKVNFCGARFEKVRFGSKFQGANFDDAEFHSCGMRALNLRDASFKNAKFVDCDLSFSKVQGADFTGADLSGAKFDHTEFDEKTIWPAGFKLPSAAKWMGKTADPRYAKPKPQSQPTTVPVATPVATAPTVTMTFEEFAKKLPSFVDAGRLADAKAMLRAGRFELFAEVSSEKLLGIIRSPSSEERVYCCKLASDGNFSCGTQNMRVCAGLRGAICKHLLVLIVGLAKSGKVDLATTLQWVRDSRSQRPNFDKEEATAVFLKYQGAETGEIEWRPTETIPEDYHAL